MNYWLYFTPFFLALLITLFIEVFSKFLPPRLPLFYSLPWGEKQLANSQQLLIIPAIIILVTLCNVIISWQLHTSQIFFKRILLFSSILVCLILTITFLKIILIFI
ncbi:hypothetical protein HYW41_04650 [Candidatus Daviesbacteria bacterium]|nr:hypothetical protein [Candidatus Daviesbacteria bacterium]